MRVEQERLDAQRAEEQKKQEDEDREIQRIMAQEKAMLQELQKS